MQAGHDYFHVTRAGRGAVRLHRLLWGNPSNPTVVLLHGGGANAHWWAHLAPDLAADGFHAIALDFRGHGDSDHPDEVETGAFGEDLAALVDTLGDGPLHLIGHSMGAGVAQHYCSGDGADRVDSLILLDPARGGARQSRRAARLALALKRTYPSREEAVRRFRFFPPAEHASETLRESIAGASVRRGPDGRWGYKFDARWFGTPGAGRPDLTRIRVPTLVLRGAESELLSAEGAEELVHELPEAELRTIEGAGHHVLLDRPAETLEAIRGHLARSASS